MYPEKPKTGIRLAERGWRQIEANPVALAHHLLNGL
jgi:hypothetical protein